MREVDDAIRDLERQRRRLQPNQGRIARRNARRGFLGAMKALRNALNKEYPRYEQALDPETYVVDIFEKAHREGRRLLKDRWRVVRRSDFAGFPSSIASFQTYTNKHGFQGLGSLLPTNVRAATHFATWCQSKFPNKTFRLRRCGEKEGLVATVLS